MPRIDGRKLSHKALEHMRVLTVRRVVEDGETPSEVMDSLGLCRTSIYPWLRRCKAQGLEALAEKIAQGPEPKLSDQQRQQVRLRKRQRLLIQTHHSRRKSPKLLTMDLVDNIKKPNVSEALRFPKRFF